MSSNRKIKEQIISLLLDHSRIMYNVLSDMAVFYNTWVKDYESNKESLEKKKKYSIFSVSH